MIAIIDVRFRYSDLSAAGCAFGFRQQTRQGRIICLAVDGALSGLLFRAERPISPRKNSSEDSLLFRAKPVQ